MTTHLRVLQSQMVVPTEYSTESKCRGVWQQDDPMDLNVNVLIHSCRCVPQVEAEAMVDGPENPFGNGFVVRETPLATESEAQRVCSSATARYWKVSNPAVLHPASGALRHPTHVAARAALGRS